MAEWSNATDLRSVSPGSAGSNPAGDNSLCIGLKMIPLSSVIQVRSKGAYGSSGRRSFW